MDDQCNAPNSSDLLTFVESLSQAVEVVKADDLSGLAKMHGFCESIGEIVADQGSQAEPMKNQVGGLVKSLEALILGEAEDAAAALKSIEHSVAAICELAGICAGATDGTPVSPTAEAVAPVAAADSSAADATEATVREDASIAAATASSTASSEVDPGASVPETEASETPPVEVCENKPPAVAPYVSEPLRIEESEVEFLKGFVEEACEHIENIEAAVLEVEQGFDELSRIDDLFRPFHTIKGMAGFLNLRDVNCLTHEVETLLDLGRKGKKPITSDSIDLVFEVVDVLKAQVGEISVYVDNPNGEVVPQPPVEELIARLREFISDPTPAASTPEQPPASPSAPEPTVASTDSGAGESAPPVPPPVTEAKPAAAHAPRAAAASPAKPVATGKQPEAAGKPAVLSERTLRIDTSKLDAMVDMVGELVIAQTLVTSSGQIATDPKVTRDVAQVTKIIRDIQAVAMGMRMVQVGPTFHKMARLVRDVSRKAGKTIELHISGEDTELDKNVIEQIGDPLVHMIRNACDHGVEPPEQRHAAGKPPVGNVWLKAAHQGGNIIIEIEDDGKGLDTQKLIEKGIERGIVQPGQELTDQQAYQLVFHPGFSMAAKITDISGRGVGMDVVKRNLEQLRGTVDITSELGKGSKFAIRLPLTLAIIDGMIVRIGRERCIIPTIAIEKSLRPKREQITSIQGRSEILNIRGKLVPLIQLGELFGLTGRHDPCEAMVVIAECDGRSIGLVVEELIGQQQVVIKTLGERFEKLRGISGAAILGDGRVGLILEMSGIAAAYARKTSYSKAPYDEAVPKTEGVVAGAESKACEGAVAPAVG